MMAIPFSLIWASSGAVIHGGDVSKPLVFPVLFPGKTSIVQQINLSSAAKINGTFDVLSGVKLYLTGDPIDLNVVQGYTPPLSVIPPPDGWPVGWPNLGNTFTTPRPEMNGGLEISFDGTNWNTFSAVQAAAPGSVGLGDQNDPSSWLQLPATSIGLNGSDGILGPYDVATLYLRYVIPNAVTDYRVFDVRLSVSCDVV